MRTTGSLAACSADSMIGSSCLSFATADALLTNTHQTSPSKGPASMLVCKASGMRARTRSKQVLDSAIWFNSPDSVLDSAIACKTVGIFNCLLLEIVELLCT